MRIKQIILLVVLVLFGFKMTGQIGLELQTNGVEWEGEYFSLDVNRLDICKDEELQDCAAYKTNQRFYFKLVQLEAEPTVMIVDYINEIRSDYLVTDIKETSHHKTIFGYKVKTGTKVVFTIYYGLNMIHYEEENWQNSIVYYFHKKN